MHRLTIFALALITCTPSAFASTFGHQGVQSIEFPSKDKIRIRADLHAPHSAAHPFIIAYHQAGWSRGEYQETAPKLNALGFNVLAVDLRSGRTINHVANETAARARAKHLPTAYLDAYPDMVAALSYVRKVFRPKTLLIWGSSYSAALVLRLGAESKPAPAAIVAFSPGEYFQKTKGSKYIRTFAKRIKAPVFIASARAEKADWQAMYDAIPTKTKVSYLPRSKGNHGSRALWSTWSDHRGYWDALVRFLKPWTPAS